MPININTNMVSLRGQRLLNQTSENLAGTFSKLSSGRRINRASDDAAGLAIAESLRAQARVTGQALRNTNDGISTIAIADGALGEVATILNRLAELASQSANGTITTTQRSVISNEFVALSSEIERIAASTEFNGIKLLSGNSVVTVQVGLGSGATSQIGFTNQVATLQGIGLGDAAGALTYSINGETETAAATAARLALDAVNNAIYSVGASRGILGAVESRLSTAINNLGVARENIVAAESRVRDVDVAEEAANMTRLNILQQAGAAVLAQANQAPTLALQLLR
ncbi:MAG: flagellin [Pseudomonadota bacterium]